MASTAEAVLEIAGRTGAQVSEGHEPAHSLAVEVRGITKRYGPMVAVEEVSFGVERGAFVTLLGPSGSGKTTLLRMIAGFVRPTSGEIRINGAEVSTLPPYRRSIGVVFQSLAIFPHMTVAENVAYPLRCRRFDRREIPDLVAHYLKLVRLGGFERRRVDQLSGGQRQRVAIARALVYRPDLLLLDEPLAALDKKLREEIQMELRRIQQELGVTTINVTHDQREALVMSDDIIVLDGGRVQQKGSPGAIYRNPANRFVACFIGQTNVLSGTVQAVRGDRATIAWGGTTVAISLPPHGLPMVGDPLECAVRAEKIGLARSLEQLDVVGPKLRATVVSAAYEGDRVLYEVAPPEAPGTVLRAIEANVSELFCAGDSVAVGWNSQDMTVLGLDRDVSGG